MMTVERFEELMAILEECGDITVYTYSDGARSVTIEDFFGFEEDGAEIERPFAEPILVSELLDFFYEELEEDFYLRGEIFGVKYQVGWGSMEI